MWDRTFSGWVKYGCQLVNCNLSMAEWQELIPGTPYRRTCPSLPSGPAAPRDAPAARY